MQEKLFLSTETFLKEYLECEIKQGANPPSKDALISHIKISNKEKDLDIYFKATKTLFNKIAEVYTHEKLENEAATKDFAGELLNIIAGMTKVQIEENEKDIEYHLSTPTLLNKLPSLSSKKVYKIYNKCFMVGIK